MLTAFKRFDTMLTHMLKLTGGQQVLETDVLQMFDIVKVRVSVVVSYKQRNCIDILLPIFSHYHFSPVLANSEQVFDRSLEFSWKRKGTS